MPYRRPYRRYRKRRSYKKRSGAMTKYQRPKDTFDYARQAWKAAMQLKRMVNVEYKKHSFEEGAITAANTWGIRTLSTIPQGDGSFQRDGVSVKTINLTCRLRFLITGAATSSTWRIIILQGKSEQGDGPSEYLNAYEDGSTVGDIMMFKNNNTRYNSVTLYDKIVHLEATNPLGGNTEKFKVFNIKLNHHIRFDGATAVIEDGGLYMLFVCQATSANANMGIHTQLSFTDN